MCIECGNGKMQRKTARLAHEIRGFKFEVEGQALVCSACGFATIPSDRIAAHSRLVDEAYRKAAHLLTAAQIRAAR